ncbi:ABC transporter permease [Perlabentimonas gracilis]|uniref:ABC transporter permease n=1 Tax=Perlabentimonas gracilis TaxID=2715279 RepID=UPI00140E2313|nr:ABC transporter permease [Perlabentimonas gracilis]NHB67932.1 FtsX-like permease family protein [Perlabentimonas gracilis]
MFIKNFKIFIKQLMRNRAFSFITIAGFSFALMFVILLSVYVTQEFSVDSFHENKDRIYRLVTENSSSFPPPMGEDLMGKYPEIENYTRFYRWRGTTSRDNSQKHTLDFFLVDSSFFNIFSFKVIEGNPKEMLLSKNSIVLVESYARMLFGNENPIGQEISVDDRLSFVVTGIVEDFGPNTHFPETSGLVNFSVLEDIWMSKTILTDYGNCSFVLYLMARPNTDLPSKATEILAGFKEDFWLYSQGFAKELIFEPLQEVYFSKKDGQGVKNNSKTIVTMFSSIVVLILLLAIINYVNLSLAQSSFRSREVSIKKLFGSSRSNVFFQFVLESVMLCLLSFNFALVLAKLAESTFNNLLSSNVNIGQSFNWTTSLIYIAGIVIVGVVSGSIPAITLSRFSAVEALKGAFRRKSKGTISKLLIAFQYTAAIALIACTWIISNQTSYLRNFDLGFKRDNIVYFGNPISTGEKEAFKNELKRIAGVVEVAYTAGSPLDGGNNNSISSDDGQKVSFQVFKVDSAFFNIFGITGTPTGAAYSPRSYWINQTAIRELNLEPLPVEFSLGRSKFPIYGVINDFHFRSLYQPIGPALVQILPEKGYPWTVFVKIEGSDPASIIQSIKNVSDKFTEGIPIEPKLVDDAIAKWYEREEKNAKVIAYFSLLAIVISVMGIFGMAAFYITQRIKEIGIRKVNGATDLQIMGMLNKGFIKWVVVAMIVAIPVAYFVMERWLQSFPYRTPMHWWVFLLSGLVAVLVALVTVSWLSYRASTSNPVKALQYE